MPQLDITNWFHMFMFTWMTLLITLSKTTNTKFVAKPDKPNTETKPPMSPW